MKILAITFEAPSNKSGGGIGILQSLKSLLSCGEVDYIGPDFNHSLIDGFKSITVLSYSNNIGDRAYSMLHGITNGYYRSWKTVSKSVEWDKYDVVSVEFTRFFFVVKEAKLHDKPVIIRMHNVEKDYFHNLFKRKKTITSKIREIVYSRNERKCVKFGDAIITLTDDDSRRTVELYGSEIKNKIFVNPVCVEDNYLHMCDRHDFLITGSFWYGPNADGVLWFLNEVWNEFRNSKSQLIIAGANPNPDIINAVSKYSNVGLVTDPEEMSDYFRRSKYYVAPIFSGAGMKVKIAEAMMHGLPILASRHALIGYNTNNAIVRFDSDSDLVDSMKNILKKSDKDYEALVNEQRTNYKKHYSISTSSNNYKNILGFVLKK